MSVYPQPGDNYNALPTQPNQVLPQANSSLPYNPIEYNQYGPAGQNVGLNQNFTPQGLNPPSYNEKQSFPVNNTAANQALNLNTEPTAPSEEVINVVGYESVADIDGGCPPPSYEPGNAEKAEYQATRNFEISEDEARECLVDYVSKKCCYGKSAAKKMKMKDIISSSALHYTLETFMEIRTTKWARSPYFGGPVDGPENGIAPGPWQIDQQCSEGFFKNQTYEIEVPHTAHVQVCFNCMGVGYKTCTRCYGSGHVRCTFCHGNGRKSDGSDCTFCRNGQKSCTTCHGKGRVRCPVCQSAGKLKKFIQLTVAFKNYELSHVIEGTDLPDKKIEDVSGEVVFEQTSFYVAPVSGYPNNEIDEKSRDFVQMHSRLAMDVQGRQLQQRQKLQCVPVFECEFKWKDDKGRFWVYGLEQEVFTEDYPQTCCWGCNVM